MLTAWRHAAARADTDGNGTLEPDELKAAFAKCGVVKTDEEITVLIKDSGGTDKVTLEQFKAIMAAK